MGQITSKLTQRGFTLFSQPRKLSRQFRGGAETNRRTCLNRLPGPSLLSLPSAGLTHEQRLVRRDEAKHRFQNSLKSYSSFRVQLKCHLLQEASPGACSWKQVLYCELLPALQLHFSTCLPYIDRCYVRCCLLL